MWAMAGPTHSDQKGFTPLHAAAAELDSKSVVELLAAHNETDAALAANTLDSFWRTPLHWG